MDSLRLKELKKIGSGADVVSVGELLKATKAGISPKKIVFSGIGKTEEEIRAEIDNLENRLYDRKVGDWSYLAGEGYGPEGEGDVVGQTMTPEAFKKVWQEQNEGPGWKMAYEEYLRNKNYEAASTK